MPKKGLGIVLLAVLAVGAMAQNASDIIVPSGFRVEKVLETNKCQDPQGVAFLSNGDFSRRFDDVACFSSDAFGERLNHGQL